MQSETTTDAPALAAATVAGAVGVFVAPGPYGYLSLVIGLVMLLLVLGYSGGHRRSRVQSAAFSAVIGFAGILVAGCALEAFRVCIELGISLSCIADFSSQHEGTKVTDLNVAVIWVVVAGIVYPIDRWFQRGS